MPFIQPSKEAGTTRGNGRGVCLLLIKNGLGDALHTMPAIVSLLKQGSVTVYCREFHAPIYESIGCEVVISQDQLSCTFKEDNKNRYERILDFPHWGGWECSILGDNVRPQMEQFAELCDVELPISFSWVEALKPERTFDDAYILFAPDSTERWRTIPDKKAEEIFDSLQSEFNVRWITSRRTCDIFKELQQIILEEESEPERPEFIRRYNELASKFDTEENKRMIGKTECADFQSLLNLVYNAGVVISAENGLSNLAGALGKELILLGGPTSGKQIIGEYSRYHFTLWVEVRSEMVGCKAPCWRHEKNGFINGLCQGKYSSPQCLESLSVEQILKTILSIRNYSYAY